MATVSKIENAILKQKIRQLTHLCKDHKSEYEQMKAQLQVQLNQTTETYVIQLNSLKQQIQNQKMKLISKQTQIKQFKHKIFLQDISHSSQIKSLQYKIQSYVNKLKHTDQNNISQQKQIRHLETELSHKDDCISTLKQQLNTLSDQYRPNRSPSTVKIIKSMSISRISPTSTPIYSSPEISAMSAKIFSRHHTISPISSLSSSNLMQLHVIRKPKLKKSNKKNREMKNIDINKWSDTMHNSKPPPIDVSVVGLSMWKTPTDIEREASDDTDHEQNNIPLFQKKSSNSTNSNSNSNSTFNGLTAISPFIPLVNNNVITPQSHVSCIRRTSVHLIKNSETEISEDIDTT